MYSYLLPRGRSRREKQDRENKEQQQRNVNIASKFLTKNYVIHTDDEMHHERPPFSDDSPMPKRPRRVRARSSPPNSFELDGERGFDSDIKKENVRDRQRRSRNRKDAIAEGQPISEEDKLRRDPRNLDVGDFHPARTG